MPDDCRCRLSLPISMYEELEVPGQYGNLRFMCLVDVYRKHFTYSPTELPIKDAVCSTYGD